MFVCSPTSHGHEPQYKDCFGVSDNMFFTHYCFLLSAVMLSRLDISDNDNIMLTYCVGVWNKSPIPLFVGNVFDRHNNRFVKHT